MNFHSENILRYIFFIFKIIILYISLLFNAQAFAQNKIGSVTAIEGSAISINTKDEERELSIFDSIYINDEIFVSEDSTLTIQYLDNTTIILKEFTNLNVYEFEKSEILKKFNAKLEKGQIIIESGSIAKSNKGEMLIDLSKLQLGVRGTRINLDINESGESKVVLAEDSFGNVGEVSLNLEGQTTNLENPNEVVELNQENEFSRRNQTLEETEELNEVNNSLVEVSKINEDELEQQLNQKLQDGKLEDANNDGIINETDIEVVKQTITNEKKANLDFIVDNSKTDNTDFLSNVLDQSDEKNIGETITKIIEVKDDLIEDVVDNLSDKENTFITSSASEDVVAVKEKIFETIVLKETTKSAEILSKVMSKSDEGTIASVIDNITEKNLNKDSTLSLKVMADFSENSPEKLEEFSETNSEQVEKLTIDAVQKATASNEDVDLIAKVVATTNDEIANIVVEEVSKTSTDEKQNLSAKVLKAIVDSEPDKIEIINDDVKDIMIQQTIEAAKNQQEGTGIQEEEDLTDIISDIIVKTDAETAAKMIDEVNETETDSNLSLRVISGISEKDSDKLNELSTNNKEQMQELTETAVQNAENTSEDSQLIANVVAVVSDEVVNEIMEEVSKISTDEKQSLSAQVLKAIVDTDADKIEIINDDVKETMIEQTIESAKNQQEGTGILQSQDMTSIVSDIIVNTDTETASKIINELNDTQTETNLSLEIISGITQKDSTKLNILSENNKEQIEILAEKAVENAENTSVDSQLIANIVSVANDELANKVVEEVSKVAIDEKQSLSVKVLKAIVDTEPEKIEIINEDTKDNLIEQVIDATKDQQEGNLIEEDDLTDAISEIIVKTDTNTATKVIEEINNITTESNLSLEIISAISEKDSEIIDALSEFNKEQMDELTIDAVQNAENTSEDSDLIAQVISVVNDDLINVMIEEVSKVSVDEKQTLSAKVLKSIVETEPDKMEIINNDVKDVMIQQTVVSAKNQKEGTGIQEEENFTDIVSDIIVNTNTETASKLIEEINDVDTETNLSLEVISSISEKDAEKLNTLSDFNEEQMNKITMDAVQNAENTSEDSQLIANVVSVVNDELINTMIEEVGKTSIEEKQSLSAKVLKAIVDTEPSKIETISEENKDTIIKQTIESAKDQKEGNIQDEEDLSDFVAEIIVNTDAATASKVIEEINDIETDTNLSLEVMSGISNKDENKLNDLSDEIKDEIEQLAEDAVQKAENTSEDSQKIADVVSVVNNDLINKVVEDVSQTSVDDKQSLSAKVLKAIVDTDSTKVEIIDDNIKDIIIEQTIESAKNQEEGTGILEEENFSDIVSDIIVNTDNDTAIKMIEEINDVETDTNLSLEVMSGISNKDSNKLNDLSLNIQDEIEQLAEDAIQKAENTIEDSEKIVDIVSAANTDLLNVVVEEVGDVSIDEKQSLSAKVLKGIVETEPDKMVELNEDNKNDLIENSVETAKKQQEGEIVDDNENFTSSLDYTKVITDIVTSSDSDTATKVLEQVDDIETDTDLKLDFLSELDDKSVDILSSVSNQNDEIISNLVSDAVDKVNDENNKEKLNKILNESEGTITDKIIEAANDNEKNKDTVSEALVDVAETNIDKLVEVLEGNTNANEVVEVLKDKIEQEEAVTIDDFEEVFEQNISPN